MRQKIIAFVPARSGSKRIPDKNIRQLAGHPLMAYTIAAALQSEIFDAVICATNSSHYAEIAQYYGAEVPFLRDDETSGDESPDISWVKFCLETLEDRGRIFNAFSILRPTSPFRMPETIIRAWKRFCDAQPADSIRAVEKCAQHPGKMWVKQNERLLPLLPFRMNGTPWHSNQYAALPEIYVQNASLEIAWCSTIKRTKTISGETILAFESAEYEGFDINNSDDWCLAESLIKTKSARLPHINNAPFPLGA